MRGPQHTDDTAADAGAALAGVGVPNEPAVAWSDASRRADFERWLQAIAPVHGLDARTLRAASADASFRRYLRIGSAQGETFIVMDAPPPHEDVRPFVRIASAIAEAGLHAPRVLQADEARGFLLLSDLGRELYLDALKQAPPARADALMRDAIAALVQWQGRIDSARLPPYDEALLRRELALFPDWCVQREFGVTWTDAQRAQWEAVCRVLVADALAQPQVAVHRDYMPRNLMITEPNPGILDFQDAVRGPVGYDIASLLRDAFLSWDEERELDWAVRWWDSARRAGVPVADDFSEAWRQIEWIGLQRHLKVAGIFCRLKHRDGKAAYAADLPRFFSYITRTALRYRPLAPLLPLIEPLSGQALSTGFTF